MSDQISPELFKHLVHLAALELDEREGEYLRRQLNNQLKSIEELLAIPVDETTPLAAHGVTYTSEISQEVRQDEWLPDPASAEIVRLAPESEDGYIVVPEIPHTDLG
jgi:aspartyl-tRNA(Asn)/glutamyl-tRNA(Gln) amidotransferase subunit C